MRGPRASQALAKPWPEVFWQRFDEWAGITYAEQARSKQRVNGNAPSLCVESAIPVFDLLGGIRQIQKIRRLSAAPAGEPCQIATECEDTLGDAASQRPARGSRLGIVELHRIDVHCRDVMSSRS
jgi:hypothetical protein